MIARTPLRLFTLLVAVLLLTGGCAMRLQNIAGIGGVAGDTYRITAMFDKLERLPIGGTVRVGQQRIGQVTSVETRHFQAMVHMDIKAGVKLPVGTRARLQLTSALGEQEVVLSPSGKHGENLTDGALIPMRRTSAGPDVEQTLAAVGALVNGSGIAQARTIIDEVTTALDGRAGKIHDLLAELDAALGSLADHGKAITSLIDSLHSLSSTLDANRSTLRAGLTRIEPAVDVLRSQREEFLGLLGKVNSLAKTADDLLRRSGDAFADTLHELRPVLRNLRGIDGRLGTVLRRMDRFANLIHQAIPGDYLLLDGTIDVPGTIARLLTPDLSKGEPAKGGVRELLKGGTR